MSARFLSPWAVTDDNGVRCYIRNSDGQRIASVNCEVTLADARLMAAAPELLEALQEAFEYLDMIPESAAGGCDEAVRIARKARAAIAKATGEQA